MFKDNPFLRSLFGRLSPQERPEVIDNRNDDEWGPMMRPKWQVTLISRPHEPERFRLWQFSVGEGYRVIIASTTREHLEKILPRMTDEKVSIPRRWKIQRSWRDASKFDVSFYRAIHSHWDYIPLATEIDSIDVAMDIIYAKADDTNPPPPPEPPALVTREY